MKPEIVIPKDTQHWRELRSLDVTSTEVAALFGCSPYTTPFELWHRKRDRLIVDFEENERMKWGTRLQDAIGGGIAKDNGWHIRAMPDYWRLPEQRMGSSFDFGILSGPDAKPNDLIGLLEIKNVDFLQFRDKWLVEGENIEAPPHIELQAQYQLAITGLPFVYIGALVAGNEVTVIKREPDKPVIAAIFKRVEEFWGTVDRGEEPTPDFNRDAHFVASLHNYSEPGKLLDASSNAEIRTLAKRYRQSAETAKLAESDKQAAKAELLTKIGDHEKVFGDGFKISAGMIGPTQVAYERKGYRDFRITWKKEAAE